MTGLVVAGFVALCLIGIGVGALVAPRASSRQYGILLEDARALAFIRAMGARDLVIGVLLLMLASAARTELLAWGLIASAAIALVDFAVVSAAGARGASRLVHALGGVGLVVAGLVLFAARASGQGVWVPEPGATWQWQITGVVDESLDVDMYDVDLFDAAPAGLEIGAGSGVFTEPGPNAGVIERLHARGIVVICYVDTGSWEEYRPDAALFPEAALGNRVQGWREMLNIRGLRWVTYLFSQSLHHGQ
jgi:hypothetical protein